MRCCESVNSTSAPCWKTKNAATQKWHFRKRFEGKKRKSSEPLTSEERFPQIFNTLTTEINNRDKKEPEVDVMEWGFEKLGKIAQGRYAYFGNCESVIGKSIDDNFGINNAITFHDSGLKNGIQFCDFGKRASKFANFKYLV